jgi:site-specific DNA recombinase
MKRFAFYGRVSTEDQQDPESSRNWQYARATQLIGPADGRVVAEFFDVGMSRSLPWKRRPQAARLLDTFKDPKRGFDAVVIGEPQRAFYGNQFGLTFPVFVHYGVELWVPEVGGRVDPGSDAHDLVMALYGGMSKGERQRIKTRVRAAMATQAATEGRFLGGRPPYGYQLADAGPHPNPGKAANGQRLKRLELDPITAPIVRRIFAEYLAGSGLYAIAEGLNRDGVPCPSAHDRVRNRHRLGIGWAKSTVRAILTNPRYTGRQVWNRQRRDECLIDVDDVALGHETRMRWNDPGEWVWSAETTHQALVTPEAFAAVQQHIGLGRHRPATRKPRRTSRPYILRGLIRCGLCGRTMNASWNNDRAHYRCMFPKEYAGVRGDKHRAAVYLREDEVVAGLDDWLMRLFDSENIDETCALLACVARPTAEDEARADASRRRLVDCDARLTKYRAALDNGGDPAVIGGWIAEVQGDRLAAQRELEASRPMSPITAEELRELVARLGDMRRVLGVADPALKAKVYADLGITMTYRPVERIVSVEARPCTRVRVGGGT